MIVVDASVVNKLFLPHEEGYEAAKFLLQKHLEGKEEIVVPDILFYEVANTLATKTAIAKAQVTRSLKKLYVLQLTTYRLTMEDVIEAARLAKQYGTSIYDIFYAVLAKEKKCDLVTADTKFVSHVKLPFIKLLAEYE